MNILFDLNHPVDVNFFKSTILILKEQGHRIIITYRSRGKLQKIVDYELSDLNSTPIGKHYKRFLSKFFGQLIRDLLMFRFQRKNKIELSVCFGPTNAISSWFNRIPYLAFEDDVEYKIPFYHANIFATRHIMPDYINFSNKRTWKYKGFKELAYLYPGTFRANKNSLKKLNLIESDYVFIREISNVSLNYKEENKSIIDIVSYIVNKGKKVVISLEDDDLKKVLEDKCIVLKEPVEDLYSILKYAQFALSSGDTMAREACLLGTPCIYTGGREMVMNNELIEIEIMYKEDSVESIFERIDLLINNSVSQELSNKINVKIENEWADTTEVILEHINEFIK
ncbi:MAG: DUF354 domain-containing protein [Candidatus Tenebribacter burtonii]|nr:DUF354 domain-containing protein [Candidatus Tenebribacter burtonii]